MGDENDAETLRFEAAHDLEEPFDFAFIETGSRLVEDQGFCRNIERARYGHELLNSNGVVSEGFRNVYVDTKTSEASASAFADAPPLDPGLGLPPKADVFGNREIRNEVHFLINGADAVALSVCR